MKLLTESGKWLTKQQLHERYVAGLTDRLIAGRDEFGTWTYVVEWLAEVKFIDSQAFRVEQFQEVGDARDPATWKHPIFEMGDWITKEGRRIYIGKSPGAHQSGTEAILHSNGFRRAAKVEPTQAGFEAQGHNWTHPDRPKEKIYVTSDRWEYTQPVGVGDEKSPIFKQVGNHTDNQDLADAIRQNARKEVPKWNVFQTRAADPMDLNLPVTFKQTQYAVVPMAGD